jgi:hypothetical protein
MLSDFFTKGHNKTRGRRVVNKLAANGTIVLPKGVMVDQIYMRNRTANAVTGGVKVGTTSGGTEVVTAQAVGASAVVRTAPTVTGYNAAAETTLYIQAVTAWNNAVVDVVVEYTEVTTRVEPTSNTVPTAHYK